MMISVKNFKRLRNIDKNVKDNKNKIGSIENQVNFLWGIMPDL